MKLKQLKKKETFLAGYRDLIKELKTRGGRDEIKKFISGYEREFNDSGRLKRKFTKPYEKGKMAANAVIRIKDSCKNPIYLEDGFYSALTTLENIGHLKNSHYVGRLLRKIDASYKEKIGNFEKTKPEDES